MIKRAAIWIWNHRTKTLGALAIGVAYVQNHLSMLGHFISPAQQAWALGIFGALAFAIGLFNTFISE